MCFGGLRATVEDALREGVLAPGDGLDERGIAVLPDHLQRSQVKALETRTMARIQEGIELAIRGVVALIGISRGKEVAVEIDVVLVKAATIGEAKRIQGMEAQHANGRSLGAAIDERLQIGPLHGRAEEAFHTVQATRQNQRWSVRCRLVPRDVQRQWLVQRSALRERMRFDAPA